MHYVTKRRSEMRLTATSLIPILEKDKYIIWGRGKEGGGGGSAYQYKRTEFSLQLKKKVLLTCRGHMAFL